MNNTMTFSELLSSAVATSVALLPVLLAVLVVVRPYVKNASLAKGLEVLEKLAAAAVSSRVQTVQNLKDPTKPGAWTPAAALSTKQSAIDDVAVQGQPAVDTLKKLGVERPEYLIGQMVEREVMAQKPDTGPVPVTVVPAKPASVLETGGMEP